MQNKRTSVGLVRLWAGLAVGLLGLGAVADAQAGSCPIPVASSFSRVVWPANAGWSLASLADPAGQTFNFTSNVSGYANSVTVRRTAGSFFQNPTTYTLSYPFTGAGPLSGATLTYMDYSQASGTVTYDFAVPLTANDAMVVMDVDYGETITVQFYDAANNLLPTAGWTAPLIKAATTAAPNASGTLTINANDITVVGSPNTTDDPTYLLMPPSGQAVSRVVVNGSTADIGTWDLSFVHGNCAIDALNDDFSGTPVPLTGGNTPSVLGNDTVNGASFAPADVLPTLLNNGGIAGLSLNPDGSLAVPAGTALGAYTVSYQICNAAAPTDCDTATVLIRVAQPAAVDDSSTGNLPGSPVTLPVLANDISVGGPVIVPSSVVIVGAPGDGKQLVVPGQGVWVVDPVSGAITFTPVAGFTGNPSPIQYTVRDTTNNVSNPGTVSVGYQVVVPPTTIDAVPDDFSGTPVPVAGGNTPSVLGNDTLNGSSTTPAAVLASLVNDGGIPGLTLNVDGSLTVPPNTPAGSYTATYQLCSAAVPAVCDTASVQIRVAQPAAVDDSSTGNVPGSPVTVPVLANDLSVGGPVIVPGSVVILGAPGDGKQLSVPNQGVWSVNPTNGAITFTPVAGFVGSPAAIQYTVRDSANNLSNTATVRLSYLNAPAAIPTLSFWGLCLLASAMAMLMLHQQRRARGRLK